jgi:hypothetical protein
MATRQGCGGLKAPSFRNGVASEWGWRLSILIRDNPEYRAAEENIKDSISQMEVMNIGNSNQHQNGQQTAPLRGFRELRAAGLHR